MTELRAGFARGDITPEGSCSLIGYDFRYTAFGAGNDGILDPLEARVVCLTSAEGELALVFSLDLCVLESRVAGHLRERIGEATKTAAERVFLCCTHTHSGPFPRLGTEEEAGGDGEKTCFVTPQLEAGAPEAEVRYLQALEVILIRLARQAAALVEPVDVFSAEFLCEFGYKRRVRAELGVRLCWNPHESPHLAPERHPDPTVSALVLRQVSGRLLLLWSAGIHPVTLGKTSNRVSADWPGAAMGMLRQWLPGCEPLYFHGAAGEAHPWLATQDRPAALEMMGRAVAGPLAAAVKVGRPMAGSFRHASAPLPGLAEGPDVSVLRIGGVALVFLPLELFASLGCRVRTSFEAPVFFATVSNGWEGYWPDAPAFAEGGYEIEAAISRGRTTGDGERLAETVIELLREAGHC